MIETDRLDRKYILELLDKRTIDQVFLDVDYTILNFGEGNQLAIEKLNCLYEKLGDELNRVFNLTLKAKRNLSSLSTEELIEYENNLETTKKIQSKILMNGDVRFWDRASMIMIAAARLGLELNSDEVKKAVEIYWMTIGENENFYEDALGFLERIQSEGIKITWVTGSDSVLTISDKNGQIELNYNPNYSSEEKKKRLTKLLTRYPGKSVIGDPIDKPEIWNKIFNRVNLDRVLVVGDSYSTDIEPAEKLGIRTILITR